jgi:DNA-binding NarL/FixJ family response regulator
MALTQTGGLTSTGRGRKLSRSDEDRLPRSGWRDGSALIRALIVARVRLYRDGLASFLNAESDIRIVDTAADWRDTRWSPETTADLVLLDAAAADASSAVAAIRDAAPTARVVVLSIDDGESDVIPWAEAGASGFVTREDSLVRLVDVMRLVVIFVV